MNIEYKALRDIARVDIIDLMNHPRVRQYMPLLNGGFGDTEYQQFLMAKEKMWATAGYGPWAIEVDGQFAGWGGLQPEHGDADLALVLHPNYWGIGPGLCKKMLRYGFERMGFESVTVLLPPGRTRQRALTRLGFELDGVLLLSSERFYRYRCHSK